MELADRSCTADTSVAPVKSGVISRRALSGRIGAAGRVIVVSAPAGTKARTPSHDDRERGRLLKFAQVDVLTALGLAGLVNMAMLAVAARAFHTPALSGLATIGQAHAELGKQAG
ncbi:MAG TPA: divalent metal cation transporter, partial [Trebonia sp.]|nr:divalent metal cation transporter [Trebonia sp.]